jgi:hypothetical protein
VKSSTVASLRRIRTCRRSGGRSWPIGARVCSHARAFIDEKGVLADAELGEPWPILQRVEQWERMVDRTLAELEQRRRKSDEPGLEQLTAAGRRVREARESA